VTTLVGLLGYPVEHSRSPAMHNAAFAALGLDWRYELVPVAPDRLAELLPALPGRGFVGANVTIPHKLRALELADHASEVASAVGAANTLRFLERGVVADNTDVEGFVQALRERAPDAPAGMRAVVLGAGGAARAVVYALIREGAARVEVWNRTPARARELVSSLGRHAEQAEHARVVAVERPDSHAADLLVNATAVGMQHGETAQDDIQAAFKMLPISADELRDRQIVVDLVYQPDRTPLERAALACGLVCVGGLDVLVHQGAASFELWTGHEAPLLAMRSGAQNGTTH
jgi:shikimate dehydrogenase